MTSVTRTSQHRADVRLDDVSKAIIEQLQEDGRQSYATIAKRGRAVRGGGAPAGAAAPRPGGHADRRGDRPAPGGLPPAGHDRHPRRRRRPAGRRRPHGDAEVSYVVTTAGSFDLLAEVVCEDDAELLDLVTRRIRSLPGVQTTETFVYLKLNKQHYNWGTR